MQMVTAAMKSKDSCSLEEKLYQPRQHIKKQGHYFANTTVQKYQFFGAQLSLYSDPHIHT